MEPYKVASSDPYKSTYIAIDLQHCGVVNISHFHSNAHIIIARNRRENLSVLQNILQCISNRQNLYLILNHTGTFMYHLF
jgi:hypothetical protein